MKKTATSLFLILSLSITLCAQHSKFSKVILSDIGVSGYAIVKSFDGNYLIAAENTSAAPLLIKIDTGANVIWNKNYDDVHYGYFSCMMPTKDSCYILAGSTGGDPTYNFFCMKIKENGDTVWSKQIDMGQNDMAYSVQQTNDNGYIIVGKTQSSHDSSGAALVKLDSGGNLQWSKIYKSSAYSLWANNVKQTKHDGYIVTGCLVSYSTNVTQAFLIKIDSVGNIIWAEKHYTFSSNSSYGSDVMVCSDGFLLLCFDEQNYNSIVVKIDSLGIPVWSKKVDGGGTVYDFGNLPSPKIHKSRDAGYFIANGRNFFKIDSFGHELLNTHPFMQNATDAVETYDSGYIIIGTGPLLAIKNGRYTPPQMPLIKTDSLGQGTNCINNSGVYSDTVSFTMLPITLTTTSAGVISGVHPVIFSDSLHERNGCADVVGSIEEFNDNGIIIISPNPFSTSTQISFDKTYQTLDLSIIDLQGKIIQQKSYHDCNKINLDRAGIANGFYFLRISFDGKFVETKKVVVAD